MKKIALITDGIWPYVLGGMQKHSYYLCKYFAQQKISIDLYHYNISDYDIALLEFFSDDEKKFINPIVLKFPNEAKGYGNYIKNSYKYSELIFEAIKDKISDYDFIYTKGFSGWKLIEEKHAGRIKCCKIGVKFHGYEMFQRAPDFKSKIQQILLLKQPVKIITLKADIVFSYGGKITEIIKNIGVPSEKIVELPSGVEANMISTAIHETKTPVKFVYLGRYERRKGIEELNQALQLLNKELRFEFHFIGPIPDKKRIKDVRIIYHNEVRDKAKLKMLLVNCDVLVCPSWSEGMPNVILEAMSNGLAVIATNVGATSLLVSNNTGWLIEQLDAAVLRNKMEEIIVLPGDKIDKLKNNAHELIKEKFTWEVLIKELIKKLDSILLP